MTARRLHPRTLVHSLSGKLAVVGAVLIPTVLGRESDGAFILPILLVYFLVVAIPLSLASYFRFRYWTTPTEIVIHSGILTRNKRHIPFERVQNIGIERSLFARIIGTAIVRVETASSGEAEGLLKYVNVAEAERIRSTLQDYRRGAHVSSVTMEDTDTEVVKARPIFSLTTSALALSGAFRFSLVFLAAAFSALTFLQQLWGVDNNDVEAWLIQALPQIVESGDGASRWLMIGGLVMVAALLAWLSGFIIQFARFYGFQLTLKDARLHKRHGLLTVHEGVIPLKRIQALIVRTNPLMRRFGWYSLEIQTMGLDRAQAGHQVGVPFAKLPEVLAIARQLKPIAIPETFRPVSRRFIRRRSIRHVLIIAMLAAAPVLIWSHAPWILLLLPAGIWLAFRQWQMHEYEVKDGFLYVRKGALGQRLWIIPRDRFQVFYRKATFFQRRMGLRTVLVDTAGGVDIFNPGIVDVLADDADQLMNELYEEFNGLQ